MILAIGSSTVHLSLLQCDIFYAAIHFNLHTHLLHFSAQASHIMPGPYFGITERIDQCFDHFVFLFCFGFEQSVPR